MKILVLGGTGFIGLPLCRSLVAQGHRLTLLTRAPARWCAEFAVVSTLAELPAEASFEAVINLAGEPIAAKRWSVAQKRRLLESRQHTTQALIDWMSRQAVPPQVLVQGSAIGVYGIEVSTQPKDETATGDASFSSALCSQWEACAAQAEALGTRVCYVRTGIVLGAHGGALARMLPAFRVGLGGRLGSGRQWMSWIHLEDMIRVLHFCLQTPSLKGPVNATAPAPVTNAEFTQVLARTLRRPALLPLPAGVISLLLGEMGRELLLGGMPVLPERLLAAGFRFTFPELAPALAQLLPR